MKDLAIAIRIGSRESDIGRVKGTIESITKNVGSCDWKFFLSLDPSIDSNVKEYIYGKAKEHPERFEILGEETIYWSQFINKAIEAAKEYEYFIKAHDDIVLQTPDFFPTVKKVLTQLKEPVAWVSFNETSYLDGHWNPPVRPGYYKDFLEQNAWETRKLFQFHNLPDHWWKASQLSQWLHKFQTMVISRISQKLVLFPYPIKKMDAKTQALLDFPKSIVKCHAPWNTFVLIKMSALKDIGSCEHWQTYNALFVDEDWGLRALQKKYWNAWFPGINYLHVKPQIGGDRSQFQIKNDHQRVNDLFKAKWHFSPKPTKEELEYINVTHQYTYIPWSIRKNSYDWDYIT